ncbi:hypothetical protein K2173_024660 [Erythroxylum novogranatense]|uniref:Uncharacterized protein n=1 Tax=Erythroxylum novogranatense TaxID=1862640 RepID=A0AAV8SVR2_9ROSI|nr:hypothetical protein K2173_024660 [Erythroxylum novogranatense]
MAAKLPVFQPKAISEASKSAAKHAREYYSKLLEQNKQYIQDPPTVERCNELSNQLFYTRLASIPNRYGAFLKELNDLKIYIKSKPRITLDNAGVAALFGVECFAWFSGAEIIGRGFTVFGYHV